MNGAIFQNKKITDVLEIKITTVIIQKGRNPKKLRFLEPCLLELFIIFYSNLLLRIGSAFQKHLNI